MGCEIEKMGFEGKTNNMINLVTFLRMTYGRVAFRRIRSLSKGGS